MDWPKQLHGSVLCTQLLSSYVLLFNKLTIILNHILASLALIVRVFSFLLSFNEFPSDCLSFVLNLILMWVVL